MLESSCISSLASCWLGFCHVSSKMLDAPQTSMQCKTTDAGWMCRYHCQPSNQHIVISWVRVIKGSFPDGCVVYAVHFSVFARTNQACTRLSRWLRLGLPCYVKAGVRTSKKASCVIVDSRSKSMVHSSSRPTRCLGVQRGFHLCQETCVCRNLQRCHHLS